MELPGHYQCKAISVSLLQVTGCEAELHFLEKGVWRTPKMKHLTLLMPKPQ